MTKKTYPAVMRLKLNNMTTETLAELAAGALGDPDIIGCATELLEKRLEEKADELEESS